MNDRWNSVEKIFNSIFLKLTSALVVSGDWTVAEFGVGKYGFGRFYSDKFNKVLGIDIVDYSFNHPGVEFFLSDGVKTEISDASVDLTVSHSVLEHVDNLDSALFEINRITKIGGYFYLSVNPLYYSSYGSHLNIDGRRLEEWQHLDPTSEYYLTRNPLPESNVLGHSLNMLTSSMFLAAVGRQPWNILRYEIGFEKKAIPDYVDMPIVAELDLSLRFFYFIGQRMR